MASGTDRLEVVETMIVPWDDMIHFGCSLRASFVSELTSTTVSTENGFPQS